ncbi:MAG: iron-containing alcohol dehydrogenase [Clostridia bacterium]|nr:iron-containing alcohol dehydrogenase [Clostridia bacterium]
MYLNINFPTQIVSGIDCVSKSGALITKLGAKKAFIVTGKSGAKKSGALDDVTNLLVLLGMEYEIFDEISENPPLLVSHRAGRICREKSCDLIIGIGGGSALDASKAVAVFAANDIEPMDSYNPEKCKGALPIIAIPTTAGTGSEANSYAVMTLPTGEQKKTIKYPFTYPKLALVDPKYTYSLDKEYTISTALDAFAHAIESYLSPNSTLFSEQYALFAAKNIIEILKERPDTFSEEAREKLAYASCAAGAAISVTGTGFPHPMGYSLTLLDGIPHGMACAVFEGEYIALNMKTEKGKAKLNVFFSLLGTSETELSELLTSLANIKFSFTEEEIIKRVDLIKNAGNYANSPYVLSDCEKYEIYRKLFTNK